jgi:Flp pilus assembly pilin Flp
MHQTVVASKVDVGGSVNNALSNVFSFVPKLVIAIVIFLVFYFVAKVLAAALTKVLQRVGFDELVERGGVRQALARSEYDAAALLAKLVYYAILLFGLSEAFGVFGANNPISSYLKAIIAFLPKAFVAIVILIIAAAIAAGVKKFITDALGGLSYGPGLGTAASAAVIFFGLVGALNQIGVATAITTPIEYAVLASLTGVIVIGVGGGLIKPMQGRWENALQRVAAESPALRENLARHKEELTAQAQQKLQERSSDSPTPGSRRA